MNGHEKTDDFQFDAGRDRTYALSDNTNRGGTADTARPWTQEAVAPMSTTHSTPLRVRVERNLYVRPTGVYEAIYRDSSGKQRLRTLKATSLREARKELTALLGQRDRAEDVAPSRATLNDLADAYFEEYASKVTRSERSQRAYDTAKQRYDSHVRRTLGLRKAQDIRGASVSQWLADLRRTSLSNFTVRGIVSVLSAVFTQAVRDEAVQSNPVIRLNGSLPPAKAKDEARVLTSEEIENLIDSATTDRYRLLITTAARTGLRQSEILGLVWDDVDFESGVLHVRKQLSRAAEGRPATRVALKTVKARRDIPLTPDLANALRLHLLAAKREHSTPESFVFTSEIGGPLYYRNVNTRALDPAAKRAKLNPEGTPKLSWHDLRHSFGSHLIRSGWDIATVSRLMGHSNIVTTLTHYVHDVPGKDANQGAALGAALGGAL